MQRQRADRRGFQRLSVHADRQQVQDENTQSRPRRHRPVRSRGEGRQRRPSHGRVFGQFVVLVRISESGKRGILFMKKKIN